MSAFGRKQMLVSYYVQGMSAIKPRMLRFALIGFWACSVSGVGFAETVFVERIDGSLIKVLVQRPTESAGLPTTLFIDGSGCRSAERDGFQQYSRLPDSLAGSTVSVIVDKSGVEANDDGENCTEAFAKYYSIEQRVLDHLRVIQHLRRHAPWWNGEIYLLGWSDGATVGTSVAAYTPEVVRAVFGGLGGGIPMATQFEDFIICAPDRTESREECVAALRHQFDEMRTNPSPGATWMGDDNTYKVWASRLDLVEFHVLQDLTIPILLVHGANDRDGVPVEAARELVAMLEREGSVDFEYWEIPEMDHGVGSLGPDREDAVRSAMFNWLFGREPGLGGPPSFGRL